MNGQVFAITDEPRATKVCLIRLILPKTSSDELPQLITVRIEDMSLVGPVPLEVNQYDLKDRKRLSTKPGITCIWQVSGRSSIPFEKWMELGRHYIDHWSFWLDIKILTYGEIWRLNLNSQPLLGSCLLQGERREIEKC